MKRNISIDGDYNIKLQTQEQKENNIEGQAPEESKKNFLAYLFDGFDQFNPGDKEKFEQKFNMFMQEKRIYAVNLTR